MPRTQTALEKLQQARRQQILKHSLRLFSIKGYDATSVNDIASEIGCSHGLIYHYFKDKEEIFITILDQSLELGYIPIFPQLSAEDLKDPEGTLLKIISHIFEEIQKEDSDFGYYFFMFLNMRFQKTAPEPRFLIAQRDQRPFGIIMRLVEAGQLANVFAPGDPRDFTVNFFAMMRGLTYVVLNSDPNFVLPSVDTVMNLFYRKAHRHA